MSIPVAIRRIVWERAGHRCEYCQMSQDFDPATFEIDHVVPEKMEGETVDENLALACFKCNNHKAPTSRALIPRMVPKHFCLTHGRTRWSEHFAWDGPFLTGLTPKGRTTVALLQINVGHRVSHRQQLITEGVFPPMGTDHVS